MRLAFALGFVGALAAAQPPNDSCLSPITLSTGANGPFSNVAASGFLVGVPGCASPWGLTYNDVWFDWTAPWTGDFLIDVCNLPGSALLSVHASCTSPASDCAFASSVCLNAGASVVINAAAGGYRVLRVARNSPLAPPSTSITVTITPLLTVDFGAPNGPGSFGMLVAGGDGGNLYWLAITPVLGAFPNGWWFGVDIPLGELLAQAAWPGGFPFVGFLGPGGFSAPFAVPFGAPSGLSLYAVALEQEPVTGALLRVSRPASWTIP